MAEVSNDLIQFTEYQDLLQLNFYPGVSLRLKKNKGLKAKDHGAIVDTRNVWFGRGVSQIWCASLELSLQKDLRNGFLPIQLASAETAEKWQASIGSGFCYCFSSE